MPGRAPPFVIIIPARFDSSRYPGKPLAKLTGANGDQKPLIQRSWEAAISVSGASAVWIATDDARIADAAAAFGGRVVMTSADCRNGTERCADALSQIANPPDIIVNLQGDAPLTPAFVVERLVDELASDQGSAMATPAFACSAPAYRHLLEDQAAGRVGGTTVVVNSRGHALYFSKQVIPHIPSRGKGDEHLSVNLHLGVYAYRTAALKAYAAADVSDLEVVEGLEQLRFFDMEERILVSRFPALEWDSIELNNPEDVPLIEKALHQRGID